MKKPNSRHEAAAEEENQTCTAARRPETTRTKTVTADAHHRAAEMTTVTRTACLLVARVLETV
jgi:hypothetical protein